MKRIIVIPAYEPDNKLIDVVNSINRDYDIIIVDDGSGSKYDNIFDSIPKRAKVFRYDVNRGKGYALKYAFGYIRDNYDEYIVITMDSDGQHKIGDAIKLGDYVSDNPNDLVLGKRVRGEKTPIRSKIGNEITRFIYRITTGLNVYDTQTGLRAFTNHLMDKMISIDGDRFEYEMNVLLECARNKINIFEIEIETIYINGNKGSHFKAFRDSYLIYKDIFRFSISSLVSFIIDYVLYCLFIILIGKVILANVIARIISGSINYFINKELVFKSDKKIHKTMLSYICLVSLILILDTIILDIFIYKLFINKYIAKIIVEVILFIFSFLVQRKIIFNR